jgi:hypothetical protein
MPGFVISHTREAVDNYARIRHFTHQDSSFHTPGFVISHTETSEKSIYNKLLRALLEALTLFNSYLTLCGTDTAIEEQNGVPYDRTLLTRVRKPLFKARCIQAAETNDCLSAISLQNDMS